MKTEMMKNQMSTLGTQRLRLPPQMAPVNRTLAASALSGQDGVVPSFSLGGFLEKALPIAINTLGSFL
jgi:hypothetical protein